MLCFYNTLTKKIEAFQPLKSNIVTYYSCGPTVYDYAHIGHARTYVFADTLQRVLEFNGYQVKRVINITDVGHLTSDSDTGQDKIEKKAEKEKKSVWQISEFYTNDFFDLLEKLNIKQDFIVCKATDSIQEMIDLIKKLENKGYTYVISDGVYFDTSKFSRYGILTGQSFSSLQKSLKAGARVEMVEGKRNLTDFALWKFTPAGVKRQMEWNSPWGKGFPGWHIECSSMSMKYLGETIDIHTGGVEHIPIHHTNEIAQSEAATGKKFVRYWLHADHLLVDGAKMSKSLGNYYRLADITAKGFSPMALRYLFLTASYRIQLNFTWTSLKACQNALTSLIDQISQIKKAADCGERDTLSAEKLSKIDSFRDQFTEAVNDDLNTAAALPVMYSVIKSNIPPHDKLDLIYLFDEVLGLGLSKTEASKPVLIPPEIQRLVKKRENLRKAKKFSQADLLRRQIKKKGYYLEDTAAGTIVKPL